MLSPFDIRSALLARHAQHVVLIHFPIALFAAGVAFDWAAQWSHSRAVAAAAYCNLLAAAVSTLPAMATGILAWQWLLEGQPLKGILLLHLAAGLTSGALICLIGWVHIRANRKGSDLPRYRMPLELVAVILVALTGHLGGFLSGVNG